MGLFDKVKNLFTEEVEVPVKSEVIQVEIPSPVREEVKNDITDSNINKEIKTEEKPQAPIFFDDEYFKELEKPAKPKVEVKSSYMKEKPEKEKKFKPTPIISPVYGVLDKNYNKEDIQAKKHTNSYTADSIDEVRKKAYGSLEDDIETTLFGSSSMLFKDEAKDKEKDLFDDLTDDDINIVEEELDNTKTLDTKGELFDLIDSMYEGKDEK